MLARQIYGTDGGGTASVKLNSRDVTRLRVNATCHSGIRTNLSGALELIQNNGGFSSVNGEWLVFGAASGFWIQRTIISGTLEVDAGAGFLQINTSRTYDNQKGTTGLKETEVFFEISSDSGGTPIVATATMMFSSENSTLD